MAYSTLADTGLSRTCYDLCPSGGFQGTATTIEESQNDVTRAVAAGVSENGMAALRKIEDTALAAKPRVCAAAAACVLQRPWRAGSELVCGSVPAITSTTYDFSRNGATPTSMSYTRPGPED